MVLFIMYSNISFPPVQTAVFAANPPQTPYYGGWMNVTGPILFHLHRKPFRQDISRVCTALSHFSKKWSGWICPNYTQFVSL